MAGARPGTRPRASGESTWTIAYAISGGWAAGINAYATVLVLGLAGRAGLADTPEVVQRTDVLIVMALFTAVEFAVDKLPYVDSLWDTVHTVVRPIVGGVIGWLIVGDNGAAEHILLAGIAGVTALASHSAKAGAESAAAGDASESGTSPIRGPHPDGPHRHRLRRQLSCPLVARVVVVGAGMAGLAAATRLADLGHQVTVYERAGAVGGRVGRYRRDGYTFDTGPALLTLPAVYRDLFRSTGRPIERVVELAPADPAVRFRFSDGVHLDLPNASRAGAARAIEDALGPGRPAQWQAIVDHGRQVWQLIRAPYLIALPGRRDLARLTRPAALRALTPHLTVRRLGLATSSDPRLRAMLERAVPGTDPRKAPAALAAVPYLHETFGRWYVAGGMYRLVDAVRGRAEERGATLHTGSDVIEVLVHSGRAAGVRLASGETVAADVVVAAVDAGVLYGSLLRGRFGSGRRTRRPASLAASTYTLLIACSGPLPLPHHFVVLGGDADGEFDAVYGPSPGLPKDPTVELSAPDDAELRPAGGGRPVTARVTVPGPDAIDWTEPGLAETYAEHVLAVLAERGLDLRDRLRWYEILTPADVRRASAAPGAWGPPLTGARSLLGRPRNQTPVRGLFLAGDSTHPGPGLALVGMSAAIVADLVGRA